MHELPVTQGILNTAVEAAQRNGGRRIAAIDLVIGDLSSIVDDSVQFYFDFLSKGTLAEGATLRFHRQPGLAACLDCGQQWAASLPLAPLCPHCGSVRLQVTGGHDLYVDSIEVEGDEDTGRAADPERQ
jgi:hydrogenase nickel incorporation protein HypA/HybF